jgi:hypothetical protein
VHSPWGDNGLVSLDGGLCLGGLSLQADDEVSSIADGDQLVELCRQTEGPRSAPGSGAYSKVERAKTLSSHKEVHTKQTKPVSKACSKGTRKGQNHQQDQLQSPKMENARHTEFNTACSYISHLAQTTRQAEGSSAYANTHWLRPLLQHHAGRTWELTGI